MQSTCSPESPTPGLSVVARSGAGSFGSLENHLRASYSSGPFADQLTASRDTSDGFIPDRNYSSNALANETWIKSKPGTTDILLATSDRPYGANLFYGPYPSWERTKGWLASIQQQLGTKTAASFGYRRHTDLFVLFVGQPAIYENNHITTSYEGALRRADELGRNTTLAYGLESEQRRLIHAATRSASTRATRARATPTSACARCVASHSPSARAKKFSPARARSSRPASPPPSLLTNTFRLRASAGHGFRQPTYVDLYYSDPATIGNPNLKPESSWSYEGGADWRPANGRLTLTAIGFRLNETNAIDYSKPSTTHPPAEKWQAVNVPTLDITGAEATPAHPPQFNPAAPTQLHRRALRQSARQLPLRVRLQLRRAERHLRVDRATPRHLGSPDHRSHPGQHRPENHPDRLPALGR